MIRSLLLVLVLSTGLGLPVVAGEAEPNKETEKLKQAAREVAGAIHRKDFAGFEKKHLVDKERYLHFYEKRHCIKILERGWTEFTGGVKENFEKKQAELTAPKLEFGRVAFGEDVGKEAKFETCEIWAAFKTKDKEKPGELIIRFVKIDGEWKVTSLE